ncbi:MAG TPA: hypothetical protein ENN18_05710 [Proteobacteria bacterium]|nr:hypothetical protein [Pseudomonadota bacterium]
MAPTWSELRHNPPAAPVWKNSKKEGLILGPVAGAAGLFLGLERFVRLPCRLLLTLFVAIVRSSCHSISFGGSDRPLETQQAIS